MHFHCHGYLACKGLKMNPSTLWSLLGNYNQKCNLTDFYLQTESQREKDIWGRKSPREGLEDSKGLCRLLYDDVFSFQINKLDGKN